MMSSIRYFPKNTIGILLSTTTIAGCGEGITNMRYFDKNGERYYCGGRMFGGGIQLGNVVLFDGETRQIARDEQCVQERLSEGYREIPEDTAQRRK